MKLKVCSYSYIYDFNENDNERKKNRMISKGLNQCMGLILE